MEDLSPIAIHPHLMQKFMKQDKNFANLLALYSFYLYHAQRQKTNQPLATDEFTKNGLNWALERVKKTKKLLKELGVIKVIQHKRYYYVHILYIYTQSRLSQFFDEVKEKLPIKKIEPKPKKEKSLFEKSLIDNKIRSKDIKSIIQAVSSLQKNSTYIVDALVFSRWLGYCHKNSIFYTKNHIKNWLDILNGRTTIEAKEAINLSISNNWKNFFLKSISKSKYHHLLTQSLSIDGRYCDTLLDIDFKDNKFIYQFTNTKMTTPQEPIKLFSCNGC